MEFNRPWQLVLDVQEPAVQNENTLKVATSLQDSSASARDHS